MNQGYGHKRGYDMGPGGFDDHHMLGAGLGRFLTSRDSITDPQLRGQVYMQMTQEGTRREKRRRDADDFDPQAKIMRKLFVKNLPPSATEVKVNNKIIYFKYNCTLSPGERIFRAVWSGGAV